MGKRTFVIKARQQKHVHHWLIDGAHEGAGMTAHAMCKTCGAETSFLNYIDWSKVEQAEPAKENTEEDNDS